MTTKHRAMAEPMFAGGGLEGAVHPLDMAEAHIRDLKAETEALRRERRAAAGLVAAVHGDGGQYLGAHGWQKACDDAIASIRQRAAQWEADNRELDQIQQRNVALWQRLSDFENGEIYGRLRQERDRALQRILALDDELELLRPETSINSVVVKADDYYSLAARLGQARQQAAEALRLALALLKGFEERKEGTGQKNEHEQAALIHRCKRDLAVLAAAMEKTAKLEPGAAKARS